MTPPLNFMSLFAGIGGLDLGLERAGMQCIAQVEIDPFCRAVLAKHWPEVPRHDDVRTCIRWWNRHRADIPVHVVAGGFPCQPFSVTGRGRRGTGDDRWGWPWMADVINAVRPDWVIVENVPALVSDGAAFEWLLSDLAGLGFDGEWGMVSACSMGAPHMRRRLFVVAYSDRVARALAGQRVVRPAQLPAVRRTAEGGGGAGGYWLVEPGVDRVADGVPDRVDRLRALGNAVVPAVAQYVGSLVVEAAVTAASDAAVTG